MHIFQPNKVKQHLFKLIKIKQKMNVGMSPLQILVFISVFLLALLC